MLVFEVTILGFTKEMRFQGEQWLLGFIAFKRDIETNLEKIVAIRNLGPITNLKGA